MNKQKIFRWICIILIVFYSLWTVYQLLYPGEHPEQVYDRPVGIIFFALLLFINEKIDFNWFIFSAAVFAFNLHNAGLYGTFILTLPADRVLHFCTNFAGTLLFYNIFYSIKWFSKAKINKFLLAIIVFFFITGIAAFGEIIEFVGYSTMGEGESLLTYGMGDFGEWNNLSWDLISNSIGTLAGILVFNIFRLRKWIKRKK